MKLIFCLVVYIEVGGGILVGALDDWDVVLAYVAWFLWTTLITPEKCVVFIRVYCGIFT
jgi:hypothetical protein